MGLLLQRELPIVGICLRTWETQLRNFWKGKGNNFGREEIACAEKAIIEQIEPDENLLLTEHSIMTERSSKLREIKHFHALGTPIRAIAGIVKMSRNTVRKFIHLDEPPTKNEPGSEILKFADYFKERIKECSGIEVIQLWKEIRQLGYGGSRSVVYQFLKNYTRSRNKQIEPTSHALQK